MNQKVFGYPEFDGAGERLLTTYDGLYRNMLMDIRIYRMNAGDIRRFHSSDEEIAVLLQKGHIVFKWDGECHACVRKDVFTEGPWAVHICRDTELIAECLKDGTEILVQRTHNNREFASKLYSEKEAPWNDVCRGKFGDTANRRVNTIFDYNTAPYSNMVLGEVLNDPGNWSGYIPHHHPQPEVYYFLFDRPEGFGASYVGDEVYKSTDGSFSAIPGGVTHPQVSAPGFIMYTCWMIRHLENNPWVDRIDDKRYTWLYGWKGDEGHAL